MKDLLTVISENAVAFKDKVVLADENVKGITYGQLFEMSGRIYTFLKNKGIGREDFVLICLPRGIKPIIALTGILRAGAAFVIVEDTYAPERIEFIRKDCGCKAVLDAAVWEECMGLDALDGFEPRQPHDAAFAVYTSGSTGNPKGVLHEYGNFERMISSITMTSCPPLAEADDRFALVAPLNFVASLLIIVYGLVFAVYNNVVPYSTVKSPVQMLMFFVKNKITGTFLTPSYIRKMKSKPPMLKFCIIGSEPANGVFLEGLAIHNFYLMSESGFAVTHFLLDKKYELTPVGKSECGYDIKLLDENGNEVPDGEEGEICFENPFVRGYLNLPEQTEKVFINGMYHSGDLAKKDEQGRLIICGRLNDMVKINGNRVEPGEIEEITKKVLDIDWAGVRIFDDGRRVFICAYYTKNITVDFEKTRDAMSKYLPYYMLPSFFIHIDAVPLKATGKMDRKALPAPVFTDYLDNYVAPGDEVETALCDAFSAVLEIQNIGIKDDFYQLGGDSMGSMEVITRSGLPGLSATDIFRGHTPEKIAELYKAHRIDGVSPDELNDEAIKRVHPLTAEQIYMVDYQFYTPNSTMYNIYSMVKFDKNVIDMEQMVCAVNKTIPNHPVFLTKFYFNEDGELVQKYSSDNFTPVVLERVTETELREIEKNLVQPYRIIDSVLYRCRVFETEEAGYIYLDVHHTIFDGTSSKVFFSNILSAYAGQDLPKDYYYYILSRRESQVNSDFYRESIDYYENLYSSVDWVRQLTPDNTVRDNHADELFVNLPVSDEQLDAIDEKHGVSRNAFFITAAAIATAVYENKDDIMVSWIYNGRNDMNEMASVGLLFRNLPVGLRFTQSMTLTELYRDVASQITDGITHSCYPYLESTSAVVDDDLVCVLYQDKMRNMGDVPGLLDEVELENKKLASQNVMDLEILNQPEGLVMMIDYASSRYKAKSISRYIEIYNAAVRVLVSHTDSDATVKKLIREVSAAAHEGNILSKNWWLRWMKK